MGIDEIPGFHALNVDEKLKLLEEIWDNVASHSEDLPVPDSHKAELQARMERFRANPDSAISLEEFQRRIEQNR